MSNLTPSKFLTNYRQNLGLTQEKMAERLSVSRGLIARIEAGNENLSHNLIEKIKEDLGVFVDLATLLKMKHDFSIEKAKQDVS